MDGMYSLSAGYVVADHETTPICVCVSVNACSSVPKSVSCSICAPPGIVFFNSPFAISSVIFGDVCVEVSDSIYLFTSGLGGICQVRSCISHL